MGFDPTAVQRDVTELLGRLGAAGDIASRPASEGLQALVDSAAHILDVDCVGVQLLDEGDQMRAVAASSPLASALELSQENTGVGPGVDTLLMSATVTVADLAGADRYVALREVADEGARSVVSAPVWVNGAVAGTLNAIRSDRHEWSASEVNAVEAYADLVATLLQLNASTIRPHRTDQASTGRPDHHTSAGERRLDP